MKKYKKYLFIILITSFLLLFSIPNVKAFDDINYEFERDILYNETNPELNLHNLRQQQTYDGTYPATYSFTNDGTFSAEGWVFGQAGGSVIVNSLIQSHKKCLDLTDTDDSALVNAYTLFNDQIGILTIEWWWQTNSTSSYNWISFRDDGAHIAFFGITSDTFRYYDGSWQDSGITAVEDVWYHHRVILNTDTEKLIEWYINGILEIENKDFWNSINDGIDEMMISTDTVPKDYRVFVDAIGFSWDFYFYSDIIDFTNDIIGNEPINWISANEGTCTSIIKDTLDGRIKILELYDEGGGGTEANIRTDLNIIINTSVKLDIAKDRNFGGVNYYYFMENDINIVELALIDDDLKYYHDGYQMLKVNAIDPNIFITLYITFNFSVDTIDVYVNDVLEGNNLPFKTEGNSEIDELIFFTDDSEITEFYSYIDNIYINPDFYFIGTNLKPSFETIEGSEGLLETDKYEFSILEINVRAEIGATSYGLWSFSHTGGGFTSIAEDGDIDRVVLFELAGTGSSSIERTGLSITENLIDVNFGFMIIGVSNNNFTILLKASDQSVITGFRIEQSSNSLFYFNGSWNNFLRNDLALIGSDLFDINLFLNYDLDIVRLEYNRGGVFIENHVFSMVSTGKTGLYEINATLAKIGAGSGGIFLDYVGLYRNGESHRGELGIITLSINKDYSFQKHYLYSSVNKGILHEGIVEGSYVVGETPFQNIRNESITSGVREVERVSTINNYEFFWKTMSNATLVFTCVSYGINISSIVIEGSKLVEGLNEYFLIFSSGGLDSKESYFYVRSNELRFIHNTSIDDVNEFIQAEFNINDLTSVDTAISFTSNIELNAFGFLRINYDEISQVIQMENILRTKRVLLTTGQTINSFIVLVSDTNKNIIEGITEGLIKDISLLDIETAIVSIVSLNLIQIIIPLIIIIIPTVSIAELYGDYLVSPLFLLFSLMLTITSLIPVWLFFIIALSSTVLLFFEKNKKVLM